MSEEKKLPELAKKIPMVKVFKYLNMAEIGDPCSGAEGDCKNQEIWFADHPCKKCTVDANEFLKLVMLAETVEKMPVPSHYEAKE